MDLQEAKDFIRQWSHWNVGQMSVSRACGGPRTVEDDVLDARRTILLNAYNIVKKHSATPATDKAAEKEE